MIHSRFLTCQFAFSLAISGCNGSSYPVGSEQQTAGDTSVTGGVSGIASGGVAATGGSEVVKTSAPVTGGATAVGGGSAKAGATSAPTGGSPSSNGGSSAVAGSSSVNTGGASAMSTGGTTVFCGQCIGGASTTGGRSGAGGGSTASGGSSSVTGGVSSATGGSPPASGGSSIIGASSVLGTGGGTASNIHSRVVLIDPSSNQFVAYDSEGQIVHDYASLLNIDGAFDERMISIEQRAMNWDESPNTAYFVSLLSVPLGKKPTVAPSEIFVRFRRTGTNSVNLRIANVSGNVVDEFPVAGAWRTFLSSPGRHFIVGETESSMVLIRRSDHTVVWQGLLGSGAFAPDEQHLIVSPSSSSTAIIIDTSNGHATNVNISSLPSPYSISTSLLDVDGALNTGAAVSIHPSSGSPKLFWVTWNGAIQPFDAQYPEGAYEQVSAANQDDTRLAWVRISTSSGTPDASLLGWFEFDPATMTNRSLPNYNQTSSDCYDPTISTYYKINSPNLLACTCSTGTCETFATLEPPLDPGYQPQIAVSPRRGLVGYTFAWPLNRMPTSSAAAKLFNPQGTLMVQSTEAEWFNFDLLDELVLVSSQTLLSASTGKRTALGSYNTSIMYE